MLSNCASSDRFPGGVITSSDSDGEHLEYVGGPRLPNESEFEGTLFAELFPTGPGRVLVAAGACNHRPDALRRDKAEIIAEIIGSLGRHIVQGCSCGKRELKMVRSSWSDRWKEREARSAMAFCSPGMKENSEQ